MSILIPGKCFLGNTYLCVVPRPSFVRVRTPLLVFRPRSGQKERYIILCVASTIFVTAPIASSPGGAEIQSHFYRAIRSCMFWSTKMEHVNRFGIQKTKNLQEKKKINGNNYVACTCRRFNARSDWLILHIMSNVLTSTVRSFKPRRCSIDLANAWSIQRGLGLIFSRKDRTIEVNK